MNDIGIYVLKDGENTEYNYSNLVEKVVWSGRKGAAPRNLTVTFADSEGYGLDRAIINAETGQFIQFFESGKELFRGWIMTDTRNKTRKLTIKAYDSLVKMTNNKSSFSYKNKRADQIFVDCCNQLGLKLGGYDKTEKVLLEVTKSACTYWDIVQEALSQTYQATGKRFYVFYEKGYVYLRRRVASAEKLILNNASNTTSYEMTKSIYDTRTRLKMVTSKNKLKKLWKDEGLEAQIGVFQDIKSIDKDITQTELDQIVNTFAREKAVASVTMTWDGIGDSSVKAGDVVQLSNDHLNIHREVYVEEDTHTWEKGAHTMKLKLNFAANIDEAG